MQTTGGSAPEGTRCIFPFEYKEITYTDCTYVEHDQLWCITDSSGNWGNCNGPCGKSIGSFP